jgi:pyrroline-5-carboxylate reductase
VTSGNRQLCDFADIVILAVKPQMVDSVVKQMAESFGADKLLVSVAAGVPLSRIQAGLPPGARIVRVMPNICCVVGAGAAGYAGGAHARPEDLEIVGSILNSFGVGLPMEEKDLDAVTGPGPLMFFFSSRHWLTAGSKLVYRERWRSSLPFIRSMERRAWRSIVPNT